MWPFDQLRKRKYEKHRAAAIIVLLGAHRPGTLDPASRKRFETALAEMLKCAPDPPATWKRWARWDKVGAVQAAAMQKAGIGPGISGLSWEVLFRPWEAWREWPKRWSPKGFDARPEYVLDDFRPMHPATVDAKEFLRMNGMNIPEADPL